VAQHVPDLAAGKPVLGVPAFDRRWAVGGSEAQTAEAAEGPQPHGTVLLRQHGVRAGTGNAAAVAEAPELLGHKLGEAVVETDPEVPFGVLVDTEHGVDGEAVGLAQRAARLQL